MKKTNFILTATLLVVGLLILGGVCKIKPESAVSTLTTEVSVESYLKEIKSVMAD